MGTKGQKEQKEQDIKDLKKDVGRQTLDVRRQTLKNAKCGGNFVPNKKAAPQFAFANEEQPQAVLCFFGGGTI